MSTYMCGLKTKQVLVALCSNASFYSRSKIKSMAALSSLDVLHSVIDVGVASRIPQSSVLFYKVNERIDKKTVMQEEQCPNSQHLNSVQGKKTLAIRNSHSTNNPEGKTSPHTTLSLRWVKLREKKTRKKLRHWQRSYLPRKQKCNTKSRDRDT